MLPRQVVQVFNNDGSAITVLSASASNSGSIGIGTNDPQDKLHVIGNVKASAFIGDGSQLTGISGGSGSNAGVTTFNTRDGGVTLTSSDVTGALTYTPLNKVGDTVNGNLVIGGALSTSNITTATGQNIGFDGKTLSNVEAVVATTFVGALSGYATSATSATTAIALQTGRTIALGGDLSGSASFDGSADVTITATIQPNSVALGTDTTGNYVAAISSGPGITVVGSGSETASVSLSNTGVLSFNTRIGGVTLTSGDVTDALTFTPLNKAGDTMTSNFNVTGNISSTGTVTASNLVIVGDYVTLNTVTSNTEQVVIQNDGTGPALKVTQTGLNTVAEFYDAESGLAMIVANGGNVGIGSSSPTEKLDVAGTVKATTFSGALTGNATTASTLETGRTIAIGGAVSGSATFNGSQNITITTSMVGTAAQITSTEVTDALGYTPVSKSGSDTITGNIGIGTTTFSAARLNIGAGTTSIGSLRIAPGSLLTSAATGMIENDGLAFYATNANTRATIVAAQFYINTAAKALTNQTAAQPIFDKTFNVEGSTWYAFEGSWIDEITNTGRTPQFSFGGTGTIEKITYTSICTKGVGVNPSANLINAPNYVRCTKATEQALTAGGGTNNAVFISGVLRIGSVGTLIPQISYAGGVPGTSSILELACFKINALCSSAVNTIGNIA